LRNWLLLILLGCCALSGCGGGGSPSVAFSASSLTFGDEVEGTTSEPLLITLTNTGTAPLTITSITASANFAETNNCGSTLAAGANCAINVTLAPNATGSVKGTVTLTDNAAGSPQTVSLSGTAVTPSTLTGVCAALVNGSFFQCRILQDPTECPVGKPAASPVGVDGCTPRSPPYVIDISSTCGSSAFRPPETGYCGATTSVGSCSVQGQQCGATGSSPCCSGFTCTAGTDGSFCQPARGETASRARSSWEQRLADRLR